MATKLINTRIKNKIDDLSAWLDDGITLLKGEIAVAQVPTGDTYENPITGATEPVIELLMKVGNGTSSFGELPWLSAKAADVYNWAKVRDPSTITVKYNDGTTEKPSWVSSTLANVLEDLKATMADTAEKLDDITVNVPPDASGIVKSIAKDPDAKGTINVTMGTVAKDDIAVNAVTTAAIENKAVTNDKLGEDISASKIIYSGSTANNDIQTVAAELQRLNGELLSVRGNFSVEPSSATTNAVVQGITYNSDTGKFTVTYGQVAAGDIASNAVTTVKIKNQNVTEAKIADGNVTDVKIKSVSASKVEVIPKTTVDGEEVAAVMLPAKLSTIDSELSRIESKLDNFTVSGVRFIGKAKTPPVDDSNEVTIDDGTTSGKVVTAKIGDVVIYNTIEYICVADSGSARWQELGDQSRLGVLETLTGSLHATARTTNEYVTYIAKSDGKLEVQYAQPTVNEVLAATDKTLAERLVEIDGEIAGKSDSGHEHPSYVNQNAFSKIKVGSTTVAADTATDTVTFTGKNVTITPTTTSSDTIEFKVAEGTTSAKGIVQLSDVTTLPSGDTTGSTTAATTTAVVAAMTAATAADAKAANALTAAGHSHPYLPDTTTYAGSDTQGGAATSANKVNKSLIIKLKGGTTEGTNKFTFNGSNTKTVNITPGAIGAATSGHIHTEISDLQSKTAHISTATVNGITVNVLRNGDANNADILIFDCGGAWELE